MDSEEVTDKTPTRRVAVIGAGVSGLCCAWRFSAPHVRDKFDVVVYEQTDRVGGTWVYTPAVGVDQETGLPIHSSMYKNLRTNLPKECMEFPGVKYGSHLRHQSYISWSEVLKYLEDFANQFNLKDLINFHHVVIAVTRRHEKWKVRVKDLKIDASFEEEFDAVVVCNGHNSVPNIPSYDGTHLFKGLQMHSHDYRVADRFRDQNVLLIGFGPSGVDIGMDIERVAKKVFLSHHVQVAFKHQIGEAIVQKPDVKRLLQDSVLFEDDSIEPIDSIIYCTGYLFDFPFVTPSCDIAIEQQRFVTPLYKHSVNIYHNTMAFIGLPYLAFTLPLFDLQVQFFLKTLLGEIILPDTDSMLREHEEELEEKKKRGLKKKHFHILGEGMEKYINDLTTLANGTIGIRPAVLAIYRHGGAERKKFNFKKYRSFVYTILDDDRFEVRQMGFLSVEGDYISDSGSKFHFDFLTPSCELHEDQGMVGPLYKMLTNIYIPSMSFIAVPGTTIIFPLVDLQVQFFLKTLLGEIILPDTDSMLREYEEELEEKKKRGLKKKHFHILGEGMEKYINDLTTLANGTVGISAAVLAVFHHSGAERKKFNFKKYRSFVYTILDDDRFEVYEREESQL